VLNQTTFDRLMRAARMQPRGDVDDDDDPHGFGPDDD
jgi:hypothetical protein